MASRMTKAELETALVALEAMDTKALQAEWRLIFKVDPPFKIRPGFLRRAIAYRLQEQVFGSLKPASAKVLRKIARDDHARRQDKNIIGTDAGDDRTQSIIPRKNLTLSPGTQLVREWNGVAETVDVTKDGYAWRGQTFKTLSGVANAITGGRWSGPRFFGLLSKAPAAALPEVRTSSSPVLPAPTPQPEESF